MCTRNVIYLSVGYVVAVCVVFCVLFFPLGWFWPKYRMDWEEHYDCRVTAELSPRGGDDFKFRVDLVVDGVLHSNVTAGYDLEDRVLGAWTCSSDNLADKIRKHVSVGDYIPCWTKKNSVLPSTPSSAIRVHVMPRALLGHCFIRRAMASWVICSIMIVGAFIGLGVYACSISDRPASDAYEQMEDCCDGVYRSQMLIWMFIATALFLGTYFGVVFPMVADPMTCRVTAKARKMEGFLIWNDRDGSRGPRSSINWCSKTAVCGATLAGDGSLYRAVVHVDYAIDGKLHSAIADWDVRHSMESLKSKLFVKGKKDKVAPFLSAINVGQELPCWVTRYSRDGQGGTPRVYLRDPSKFGSYRAALICGIFFFILLMFCALCFCLPDHQFPYL